MIKMRTLIIYDDEGYIITIKSGQPSPREPIGVPFLSVEIPQGKQVKTTDGIGVDVTKTPHELILEDIPPSETDLLKAQNTELMLAVAELGATSDQSTIETQIAIAELATLVTGRDE